MTVYGEGFSDYCCWGYAGSGRNLGEGMMSRISQDAFYNETGDTICITLQQLTGGHASNLISTRPGVLNLWLTARRSGFSTPKSHACFPPAAAAAAAGNSIYHGGRVSWRLACLFFLCFVSFRCFSKIHERPSQSCGQKKKKENYLN